MAHPTNPGILLPKRSFLVYVNRREKMERGGAVEHIIEVSFNLVVRQKKINSREARESNYPAFRY